MAVSLAPGDIVVGKYRVERIIGQGGMGMVVAARHTALGELFAIKLMLNIEGVTGKQAFDRFLREARICASLKGEHVVKVQDVGELEDGRPYMVMEYLEGQDLGSLIEKKGPLSVANAAAVVLQACEALAEAHRLGIIHRDIKPPNMFLIRTPNGKVRLKLLDFGISKRVGAETKALTATGAMMGSPLYMSPEQLSDPRAVGPQTDIWAMGVVLYELVTGKVPFDGEMIYQVIQEILNKKQDPPSKHRPSLPVEIDKIVDKALRKEPAQRYASIEEFARDVRQLLQANSVISSSLSLTEPSEPELNIDIEAVTFDAASFGPTLEVSSENVGDSPPQVRISDSGESAVSSGIQEGAGKTALGTGKSGASTHSDLTKTVSTTPTSKPLTPIALAVGALVLLGIGGGAMYFLQNGSKTDVANRPVVPDMQPSSAATPTTRPAATPEVVAQPAATPALSASAVEVTLDGAPTAAAPTTSNKYKTGPATKTTTAPTGTTKKREGLF
jgi:serine/threonine protein kinase